MYNIALVIFRKECFLFSLISTNKLIYDILYGVFIVQAVSYCYAKIHLFIFVSKYSYSDYEKDRYS